MGKLLGLLTAGAGFFLFHINGWVDLILAVIVWAWYESRSAGPNQILQVVDLDKGTVSTQPMDKAAQKYLASRNND